MRATDGLLMFKGGCLLAAVLSVATAQAAPPDDAVPVFCSGFAAKGEERRLTCRRSDTGGTLSEVPAGLFLFVTDVIVNPNNVATSGDFAAVLERDDSGDEPVEPSLLLTGSPALQLHFTTPYITLGPGEQLSLYNEAGSDFSVDVRVSGFVASVFSAPLPDEVLADGFEVP